MLQEIFNYKGRMNRKAYWFYTIALSIIPSIAYIVLYYLESIAGSSIAMLIAFLATIFIVAADISLFIQRLHDCGKSAKILLLIPLAVALSFVVGFIMPVLVNILSIMVALYVLYITIIVCFIKGTEGTNKFGTDPLANYNDKKHSIIIVIIASLVVGFIAAPYAEEATKQEVTHTEIPTSTQQQAPVTK
tara:strand:- start:115 stop:684 length:570 start_codon:yes stop_codon:yes gene_type:complete